MSKKGILLFWGIAFALAGLICLALCIFSGWKESNFVECGIDG